MSKEGHGQIQIFSSVVEELKTPGEKYDKAGLNLGLNTQSSETARVNFV